MLSTGEFLKRTYDPAGGLAGGRQDTSNLTEGEPVQPGYKHCPNVPHRVP